MRERPEALAAVVNGAIVLLLPFLLMWAMAAANGAGSGVTVHPPGWSPWPSMLRTGAFVIAVMTPLAAVASWRTLVHARRRRDTGASGWKGVAEALAIGWAIVLIVTLPGIVMTPDKALPYVLGLGLYATVIGGLIGLILRTTALIVLRLTARA